jgi:glyoxylate reductase
MGKHVILASRYLPEALIQALGQLGEVRTADSAFQAELLPGASVLLSTVLDAVPAELIACFPPELGLIANLGVGTDNIDLQAARDRGITVSNTPVVTEDTADLAMGLLLATCRRLSVCERLLRAGDWTSTQGQLGSRVHGKTLGIIGFGAIGQAVARRARGFGLNLLYHGPHRKADAELALNARFCVELGELLMAADIVSLHCPLNPATRHIINRDTLAQMKPGAVLVNTGRGPLVDEAALAEALASGQLGGAGLDVFEFEPEVTPALLAFDNVTLLPHIGSATGECRRDMGLRGLANVKQFIETGSVLDPVGA